MFVTGRFGLRSLFVWSVAIVGLAGMPSVAEARPQGPERIAELDEEVSGGGGFGGIGTSVGESSLGESINDIRIPWRFGRSGKLMLEPSVGFTQDPELIRVGLGFYRSSKFDTPDPERAMNGYSYLGPMYRMTQQEREVFHTVGLVIGGEHFLSVNPSTNEYYRLSLAVEAQILWSEEPGIHLNGVFVARYYLGRLRARFSFELERSDDLETR